jgi:hypothetical protein
VIAMKGRKAPKMLKAPKAKSNPFMGKETAAEERAEMEMPPVMGGKARMRLDRPGRRLGGRVGADRAPLSSAAKRCD